MYAGHAVPVTDSWRQLCVKKTAKYQQREAKKTEVDVSNMFQYSEDFFACFMMKEIYSSCLCGLMAWLVTLNDNEQKENYIEYLCSVFYCFLSLNMNT